MLRTNPFITLPGLLITAILFVGLGAALWLHGGEAFSPGPLTALGGPQVGSGGVRSHADIAHQCERCHQPLHATQDTLCRECHTDIGDQAGTKSGVHSQLAAGQTCRFCHPDHRGANFSPALAASEHFDHTIAAFNLLKHRFTYQAAPLGCAECHTQMASGDFTLAPTACQDCHQAHDPVWMDGHLAQFGPNCLACHDGLDTMAQFDHAAAFALEGQHASLTCQECHTEAAAASEFAGLGHECADCHTEPDLHRGLFQTTCQDCHTPDGWRPAKLEGSAFDHAAQTHFSLALHSLDYARSPLTCTGCHPNGLTATDLQVCSDCHGQHDAVFMPEHLTVFGANCLDCHDGVDRMHGFDHNQAFALDGRHADLACADCHQPDPAQPSVYVGLGRDCLGCHAEPEVHAGFFGVQCAECHLTSAWQPAELRSHNFPLDHGESGISECSVCHPQRFVEYTCYGCHEHQEANIRQEHLEENISPAEMLDCVRCHPSGREEGD